MTSFDRHLSWKTVTFRHVQKRDQFSDEDELNESEKLRVSLENSGMRRSWSLSFVRKKPFIFFVFRPFFRLFYYYKIIILIMNTLWFSFRVSSYKIRVQKPTENSRHKHKTNHFLGEDRINSFKKIIEVSEVIVWNNLLLSPSPDGAFKRDALFSN